MYQAIGKLRTWYVMILQGLYMNSNGMENIVATDLHGGLAEIEC